MADNIKGIPFSSEDEGINFPQQAINAVKRTTENEYLTGVKCYVVMFAYVMGGWKALVSTSLPDGLYYEVTFNKDKNEAYVDTYVKVENKAISAEDLL